MRSNEELIYDGDGERLDVFLTKYFEGEHTRSQIAKAIKDGQVTVNGTSVKAGYILEEGDAITSYFSLLPSHFPAQPENIPIDIVYEDEHLMIINKPTGMVVHPGNGNRSGTLLNALLHYGNDKLERAGIVHRLDKNTAGLMVVAKTASVQAKLSAMFETKQVKRTYIGLVEGVLHGSGTINKNIVRHPKIRTIFTTAEKGGRTAVTHYRVLENRPKTTLVEFQLETGRTHQIRVHAKSIGHPLVGDPEYNPKGGKGQELRSVAIEFVHPVSGELVAHEFFRTSS